MTYCFNDDCGRELTALRSDARYCSNACRQRAYRYRVRLFVPYGGDLDRALDAALDRMARIVGVTADGSAIRNGSEV